jgi:uncharacterized membrane protein
MNPTKEILEEWRTNPRYWQLKGLFYCNKEDERIIVDKQNPNYGSTLNFAHRKSLLFIIPTLLFFGFILYMITYK